MAAKSSNDLVTRFTSRKFILAVSTFIAAILGATGAIELGVEGQVAGFLASGLYIIVQGAREIFNG